mmetsp:Transcript_37410/g.107780  ORF Transcript_37410/g.107780 Transcript_37410/m.107780 type:complete len:208 (+) Transcript_37410:237-860(+)
MAPKASSQAVTMASAARSPSVKPVPRSSPALSATPGAMKQSLSIRVFQRRMLPRTAALIMPVSSAPSRTWASTSLRTTSPGHAPCKQFEASGMPRLTASSRSTLTNPRFGKEGRAEVTWRKTASSEAGTGVDRSRCARSTVADRDRPPWQCTRTQGPSAHQRPRSTAAKASGVSTGSPSNCSVMKALALSKYSRTGALTSSSTGTWK